jgi:flagellar motility protein MotE (MotC chaperone)
MRAVICFLITFALACTLSAQSPMIVQAATPAVKSAAAPAAAAPEKSNSLQAALEMLQAMKAANEETLRKQAATLEQLAVLEKEADQIKVFSSRG